MFRRDAETKGKKIRYWDGRQKNRQSTCIFNTSPYAITWSSQLPDILESRCPRHFSCCSRVLRSWGCEAERAHSSRTAGAPLSHETVWNKQYNTEQWAKTKYWPWPKCHNQHLQSAYNQA